MPASTVPTRPDLTAARGRLAVVGVIAGLTSGLFGVGGGVVIVPALVALVGFDQRLAHGTSLTAILPISIASTFGYALGGEVAWGPAAAMAVGAVLGAMVGSHLLARLPQATLRLGFAALLLVAGVRMVLSVPEGSGVGDLDLVGALGYLLLGLLSGVLAGVMGVGGGIIMVPILTFVAGFGLVLAKGTSLAVIVPTSIASTLRNRQLGTTAIGPGLLVGTTGIVFGYIGARVALWLDAAWAAGLFALLLGLTAVRMGRSALAERELQADH